VSWRLDRELLFVIAAVAARGCFAGAVMAVVVDVSVVMGAGISADETDMTLHHDCAQTLQVRILRESRHHASGRLFRRDVCTSG
jgi:hypothetical protein